MTAFAPFTPGDPRDWPAARVAHPSYTPGWQRPTHPAPPEPMSWGAAAIVAFGACVWIACLIELGTIAAHTIGRVLP